MQFQIQSTLRFSRLAAIVAAGIFTITTTIGAMAEDTATAKKNADPSGAWRWESDQQGQSVKHELKLNYDAKSNKVTGTYKGNGDPIQLNDGKMDGNTLVISLKMERDGVKMSIDTEAVIDGDNIKAKSKYEAGGNTGSVEWDAKRSLQASDVTGTWDLEFETDNGTMTASLTVSAEGDKLKGEYSGFDGKFMTAAKEIQVKDGKLTFKITADRDGNILTADYSVVPRGNSLKGKIKYEFNGNTGEIDVTGKRAAK